MYTPPTNAPCIDLHLTPAMIDHEQNVQPYQIEIDVPLKYDSLPEEAQKIILQALAADAAVEEMNIQRDTITVYANLSCHLRHGARRSTDRRHLLCAMEPDHDNMCLTAYSMTMPDAEGMEHPAGAILDNIGAYFEKGKAGAESADAQAYINHIIDDVCLLAFVGGCDLGTSEKNI